TLVVCGTGMYVLGRVLRLGVFGSVMAATVYELSGPFFDWLGWPISSVMSWAGWLFVAAFLIMHGRRRMLSMTLFAVALALAVYGGYPEAIVLIGMALVLYAAVVWVSQGPMLGWWQATRRLVDLGVATVLGLLLCAPLLLPGLQYAKGSIRNVSSTVQKNSSVSPAANIGLSLHNVLHIIFEGFDGLPVHGSKWFGTPIYLFTAMYVGVTAVVLCLVGAAVRWRAPEVRALCLITVASGGLVFAQPLVSLMSHLPGAEGVRWYEASTTMAFAIALLAGFGIDAMMRAPTRAMARWAFGGFAVMGLAIMAVWFFGRGHLPHAKEVIRAHSFIWPTVEVVVGLVAVGGFFLALGGKDSPAGRSAALRTRWWSAGALLLCETAFLVSAGAPLWSSSPQLFTATPALTALERAVGSSVVGLGSSQCFRPPGLGIPVDVNAFFGVRELAVHDPLIPASYYRAWFKAGGSRKSVPAWQPRYQEFCPDITSVSLARLFGVSYILEKVGTSGPPGAQFVMHIGARELLYRVPGASAATISPLVGGRSLPADGQPGTPVKVRHPDPQSWRLVTEAAVPSVLRLRLTDVPGWSASIDGKPLSLKRFAGVMLQARIPRGRHVVMVVYRPRAFTVGIGLALVSVLILLLCWAMVLARRRRGNGRGG
ncbi:MAG TPA: YfhO family protein, partial [Acidimicrobiales bacterium]|nr:YfhO family protein [Acidimicrobiales bacterium]